MNGHFTGHFLSALAFTAASTDDPAIVAKSKYLVAELAKCQDAICKKNTTHCGYLSAYYFTQLEAMEQHEGGTWATLYTLHKIMAGLLDTFENTGNAQALTIVVKMADFLKKRVDTVIAQHGWAWWEVCLEVEFGGMNEVAYNLYAHTKDENHKVLGDYFYKARFMDLLANGTEYALTGQHANTHLPEIIGVARGWELTGNATLSKITDFFYRILSEHYTCKCTTNLPFLVMYGSMLTDCGVITDGVTGGSNEGEHWLYPDQLGTAIATTPGSDSAGYHTEESCTQYNVLKVVRHLFKWAPSAALGDDYEHKINNGVIGIQKPSSIGTMVYMTPLGNGVARPKANWGEGWGSANASFWCCYGTAVESFGKLGDSIYFHDDTAGAEQMWIVQYVSSVVLWKDAGVNVTQSVSYSYGADAVSMRVKVTVGELGLNEQSQPAAGASTATINLRIPGWAVVASSSVELNGEPLVKAGTAKNGTFLQIKSAFKPGDVITANYGMEPRWVKLNDARPAYDTVGSIIIGPYALVALSDGDYAIKAELSDLKSWLKLTPGKGEAGQAMGQTMKFTATGTDGKTMTLLPLNRVVDENYTAHLNVSSDATQCLCGEADKCSDGAGTTASGTATVTLDAASLVPIGGATIRSVHKQSTVACDVNVWVHSDRLLDCSTAGPEDSSSGGIIRSGNPGQTTAVLMKSPFVGKGTITAIELSYSYTIGYNSANGTKGASLAVAFFASMSEQCPSASAATDPKAKVLYTSPGYLEPKYDVTHKYSAPVNVSLSGLHLDVS